MAELGKFASRAEQLDKRDPLSSVRSEFILSEQEIYLDGNSLGPVTGRTLECVQQTVQQEWAKGLIRSWNEHWIRLPQETGSKIAPLVGAASENIICADSVSINIFKLLAASIQASPDRTNIVSIEGMFPTDLYMAEGLQQLVGSNRCQLKVVPLENLERALSNNANTLLMSQVNFRSGEAYSVEAFTALAHQYGARILWDLSHSVGVLPIDLEQNKVDFAVGCGYKFLNGGPGAPAFLYVSPELQTKLSQPLSGWMGHRDPFQFNPTYDPAVGMDHYLTGTQGILGLSALSAALEVWESIKLKDVYKKAQSLTALFIDAIGDDFNVIKPEQRGSQVSIAHDRAFPISQALIDEGIICDFRAPNLIRFGFAPLYIRYQDVVTTVEQLNNIVQTRRYEHPKYQITNTVT